MPRVAGVDIPEDKPVWVALTYIYGVGKSRGKKIADEAQIPDHLRAYDLTEDQISRLNAIIEKNFTIEGELRRQVRQNIERLKKIDSYRGERHRQNLPVRGQRTQSNARTQKGEKGEPVAGKQGPRKPGG